MISKNDLVLYALIGLEQKRWNIRCKSNSLFASPEEMKDDANRLEILDNHYELLLLVNKELQGKTNG